MKSTVIVRLSVEGFHRWSKAAEVFPEVAFLSERHRHVFHITCEQEVFHDDRDTEFILLKRKIQKFISAKWGEPAEFGDLSCEAIAKTLVIEFKLMSCEVSEDNENSGKVYS